MKKYTKLIGICIAFLVCAGMIWIPKSGEAAAPVSNHSYEITVAAKAVDEEGNPIPATNTYGDYKDDGLAAVMKCESGDEETKVTASVSDVSITTTERDGYIDAGNLESTIIQKAGADFTGSELSVQSVAGTDAVKYLQPTEGYAGCTVKLKVSGGIVSGGFIETNVYVTYVKDDSEDNQKKEDEEEAKNNGKADDDDDSGDIKVNDQGVDDDGDDGDFDDGGGIDPGTSAKKKSDDAKKKLKEQTAQITPKEREKDKAIAVAPGSDEENGNGPDPITVSIFALAAVIAAAFYRWIKSDLKIMRWHEQKKALKRP